MRKIAKSRLRDARALLAAGRYDGSHYLCGYALECQLKARIVVLHGWIGFPETRSEFQDYQSFRTHDLDVLLNLAGQQRRLDAAHLNDRSAVSQWDPEARYQRVGSVDRQRAAEMIAASARLLRHI